MGTYLYTPSSLSNYEGFQSKMMDPNSVLPACSDMLAGLPGRLNLKVTESSLVHQIGPQARENKVHQQSGSWLQLESVFIAGYLEGNDKVSFFSC